MISGLLVHRGVRGATALTGGRGRRPSPYLVFGGVLWCAASLAFWRVPLCCGTGQQAAAIGRLTADLLRPAHPTLALSGAGDPAYSPYTVLGGLFARVTGLGGWEVVRLAGPFNLLVFLTGLGRLGRLLTPRPWAPVLALAVLTLTGDARGAWWSGPLGLGSITVDGALPWLFAVGLVCWAWSLAAARGVAAYAVLGLLCGALALTEPVSAVAAVAGAVALGRGRAWRWAVAATFAVLVVGCWPYYGLPAVLGTLDPPALRLGIWLPVAALGVLALRRRGRSDPLVRVFVPLALGDGVAVLYGTFPGLSLLPLSLALGAELAAPRPWPARRSALAGLVVLGAVAGLLWVQAGTLLRPPRWPTYEWAAQHVPPGETVLTDGPRAMLSLPAYGATLVAPPGRDAVLGEAGRTARSNAVNAYLAPHSTRKQRTAITRRYHVRWLLLGPRQRLPKEATVVAWSPGTGEVLAKVNGGAPRER